MSTQFMCLVAWLYFHCTFMAALKNLIVSLSSTASMPIEKFAVQGSLHSTKTEITNNVLCTS